MDASQMLGHLYDHAVASVPEDSGRYNVFCYMMLISCSSSMLCGVLFLKSSKVVDRWLPLNDVFT